MFQYCMEVLHFSEATAFQRIRAARLGRTYPLVLERIRRGEIHQAGLALLAAHLTPKNHVELLDRARHKSKREIEELLADRAPKTTCCRDVATTSLPHFFTGTSCRRQKSYNASRPETQSSALRDPGT